MSLYLSFLAAFAISFVSLPGLINLLTRRRAEQVISEDVPDTHQAKKGTPTLGGIAIILATAAVALSYAALVPDASDLVALSLLLVATGALGFWDDFLILSRGRSAGQKWSRKLLAQSAIALAFVLYLWFYRGGPALARVVLPGTHQVIQLGWAWIPFAVLYMALLSNGANLSDGLDGLASGLSLIAAGSCTAVCLFIHRPDLAVFTLALAGSCLGFLWYNSHPAQIFMGNTSSIALGMALAGVAVMTGYGLLLLAPFGVFLAEAASVAIQVGFFKLTRRRIFRKAPVHHHFEMLGWKETKVVARFWIVGLLLALLAQLWLR